MIFAPSGLPAVQRDHAQVMAGVSSHTLVIGSASRRALRLPHHLATAACDLLFFLCGNNPDLPRSEAEKLEALCSCGPYALAVLSDAAGKYKKVDTAKKSDVCANYFAYGKSKDIQLMVN